MPNKFLAKSNKNIEFAETIEEHTNNLVVLYKDFVKIYEKYFENKNELELIKIACDLHDLGKINSRFQKKIYRYSGGNYKTQKDIDVLYKELNIDEIPHGVLSCCFLDVQKLKTTFTAFEINVLATAIFHHHNRKFQDKNGFEIQFDKLEEIVEKDLKRANTLYGKNLYCEYDGIDENKIEKNCLKYSDTYAFWLKFIVVKGMLNKLDYAASAGLSRLEIESDNAVLNVMNRFQVKNFELNDCQKFMLEHADKNLVVTASTGIGKTEGALLWAGDAKTFYTLPIKVSINAIYERIKKENYYEAEKTTFLHSDARSMMMKDDEDTYALRYLQARHLSYPFTVCTIDQLFYFVFKSLGTEKFPATLKYSKVIIDEIQSYTADITAFIIYGLKVLTDLGGRFLIMTATLSPVVRYFLTETIGKERLTMASEPFFKRAQNGNSMRRHVIQYSEGDYDAIVAKAEEKKKVLIICNTVKRAQDVYKKMKGLAGDMNVAVLHSRFILRDRKIKEKCIQDFAKSDASGIWISTQIVEASLDIDFDVLYTDMCTADSLLQRLGRCYRNRNYELNIPNVFISKVENEKDIGVGTVYDKDVFRFSLECIKKYSGAFFTEENKIQYINDVYALDTVQHTQYYKDIKDNLETLECIPLSGIDNDVAEKQFRNINNITIIPRKFYDKLFNHNIFECYEKAKGMEKLELKEKIMEYTTSAHLYFKKHCDKIFFRCREFGDVYVTNLEYDDEIGLSNKIDDELEWDSKCL